MSAPGPLCELLDRLKENGWPASERAIVYIEWRNLVRASLVRPPPSEEEVFHATMAERAKEVLLGLDDLKSFQAEGLPLCQIMGVKEDDMGAMMKAAEMLRCKPLGREMETNGWCNWVGYLTSNKYVRPDFYAQLREMEMDEEDIHKMMDADRLGLSELPPIHSGVSLGDARTALDQAFVRSGFHRLEMPAIDAEDPDRMMDLADCLTSLSDNFKVLGGEDIALATPDATLFLGLDRAGSSGYCTGANFVACAPKTGFPLIEVLAHECLHMHDYAMGGKGELESEKLLKGDKTGRLSAWAALLTKLHQAPEVDPAQNEVRWAQARQGLADRWESMGLPKNELQSAQQKLEDGQMTATHFKRKVADWFRKAGKGDTSEFRADVVLSECVLMRRASKEKPVWQQFTYDFAQLMSTSKTGVYSADYFSSPCEIVARSFQMLFSDDAKPKEDNPFAKRWLVFPGEDEVPHIKKSWQDFFGHASVKQHFANQKQDMPSVDVVQAMGGLTSALQARRAAKMENPQPLAPIKRAAI